MATGTAPGDVKDTVRSFWDADPCGAKLAEAPEGSPEFFAQVAATRDELEPFIPAYAEFSQAKGDSVLEVGCGLGSDLIRFARAGARVTGVDLTPKSVELVKRRLSLEGLEGDIRVADAERLPFPDASFDRVYSWGVLHHTPDTGRAVREAIRVLRPGGRICVMLYARHSWVAYGLWGRYGLLRGRPWRGLHDVVANHMESPGTKAYSARELREMFSGIERLTIDKVATPYDRRVGGPLVRLTGNAMGWFVVTRGHAPRR